MANFDLSWSLFTGLFSICAVIPGCLIYIHCQLPSQKLRPMFESLKEADEFLLTCVEEGLVYGSDADWYRSELDAYVMISYCSLSSQSADAHPHIVYVGALKRLASRPMLLGPTQRMLQTGSRDCPDRSPTSAGKFGSCVRKFRYVAFGCVLSLNADIGP